MRSIYFCVGFLVSVVVGSFVQTGSIQSLACFVGLRGVTRFALFTKTDSLMTDETMNGPVVEIWAGLECTINRIGDEYRDQFIETGHYLRKDDIRKILSLGVRTVRYPVLWEKHEPVEGMQIDWDWATDQLDQFRQQGFTPIVGLLHHGSGPVFTDLLDEQFPEKLSAYAGAVARQFPWVDHYTPVNEPLTTARFSGLYGYWYPHRSDDGAFLSMLLNQLKGVVLSMEAIRQINPSAKLVQTEDLGMTHGSGPFRDQVAFENQRRWLTTDLLSGRVDEAHPLWNYFIENGIAPEQLYFFQQNPMPPDIIGWNYYVTSERYIDRPLLDQELILNPEGYDDHVAVRVGKAAGLKALLLQAHERYGLPMAITECHLNCSREEQLRWFHQVWSTCNSLIGMGIDLRGLTVWSMMGAMDWDSLLLEDRRSYESGAFDVSGGLMRPTGIAGLVKLLTTNGNTRHPLLQTQGWWERPWPKAFDSSAQRIIAPLVIAGEKGVILEALERACQIRAIGYSRWNDMSKETVTVNLANKHIPFPWGGVLITSNVEQAGNPLEEAGVDMLYLDALQVSRDEAFAYVSSQLDLFIDRQFLIMAGMQDENVFTSEQLPGDKRESEVRTRC